jgi:uncharacterized protein (DUF488 family)
VLFTIGHSTLSADDFRAALDAAGVSVAIDTRSHPVSRWEQFRRETLEDWLKGRYEWWPQLGGWGERHAPLRDALRSVGVDLEPYLHGKFPRQRIAANREAGGKSAWESVGLHDYQFFETQPEFLRGVDELLERCRDENLAIFCCEAVWWRCHRSMIADYVVWRGRDVHHILPRYRKVKQPRCVINLHSHMAVPDLDKRLAAYHPVVIRAWERWRDKGL